MPLDPTNDMTRPLPRLADKLSATAKLGDHPSEKTWRVGDLIIKASKQSERFASPLELALAARLPGREGSPRWDWFYALDEPARAHLGLKEGAWFLSARAWIPGKPLADEATELLRERWREIALAIALHVRDLHDDQLVHGDLQPHNVLVTPEDEISLIDFPLLDMRQSERGHVLGSAPCMAPELWNGASPSHAADMYALGCLICWMVSGAYPLTGDNLTQWAMAHCEEAPKIPASLKGKLGGIVRRMLGKDPNTRPPIQELLDALAVDNDSANETPLFFDDPSMRARVEEIVRSWDPQDGRFLLLKGIRGAGKTETLRQVCARLELRGEAPIAIFEQALDKRAVAFFSPAPAPAHEGPWSVVLDLISRLGAAPPTLGQGDQLHTFELLTRALLGAVSAQSTGITLLWDDLDLASPDVRAWLSHALQAARREQLPLSLIATTRRDRTLNLSAHHIDEQILAQPDPRQWQRWRARSLRAQLRDIGLARWESLLARYGHSIGEMLRALEEELGIRHNPHATTSTDLEPASLEEIKTLMAQGACQEALIQCELRDAVLEDTPSIEAFELWLDATLRAGADATSHDLLASALASASAQHELNTDERVEIALLRARLEHGRGLHRQGLAFLSDDALALTADKPSRSQLTKLALWRAQLTLSSGDYEGAIEHAERGLDELGVSGRASDEDKGVALTSDIAHLSIIKHGARALRGDMKSVTALQKLLPVLESEEIPAMLRARANAYIAIGLKYNAEREASTDAYLRALEHIERAGLDAELPLYLLNVGTAYHSQGKLGLAREYYARGMRIAQETTRPTTRLLLSSNSAAIDVLLGRFDEASALLERALELARAHDLKSHELMTRSYQASLAAMRGEHEEAISLLEKCFAMGGAPPPAAHVDLLLTMSEAHLSLDDLATASTQLDEARTLIDTHALAALEDHHDILEAMLGWREGGSLEVMTGIEKFRKALHHALESTNYSLVLKYSPVLFERVQQESLDELVDEVTSLNQQARNAVASGLGKELREDFFANYPDLSALVSSEPMRRGGVREGSPRRTKQSAPSSGDGGEGGIIERFYRMLSLNEIILHQRDPEQLWRRALEIALSLSGAERGFLLLDEAEGDGQRVGGFLIAASQDIDGDPIPRPHLKVSLTIAEEAARTGRTVATVNAREDERFNAALSVVDLDLTSVLCVPVRDASGLLGALYIDHRFHPGIFQGETRRMMEAFGHQLAIGITNTRRLEQLEGTVKELEEAKRELDTLLGEREAMLEGLEERVAMLSEEVERQRDSRVSGLRAAFPDIAYTSSVMERLLQRVERVARSDIPVVIHGESGVGKELIASAIHSASPRSPGPFIPVNCGAIPENLFESELFGHVKGAFTGATRDREGLFKAANGGTIFLDELGEMPLAMQVKLLRVLQERKVRPVGATRAEPIDVRIVAATNRNLDTMITEGTFREDLFYRLAAFTVTIPALRERREDIPLIAHRLLARIAPETIGRELKLSPGAAHLLGECQWPGNVRQLENTLRAACVMCEEDLITERELATMIQLRSRTNDDATTTEGSDTTTTARRAKEKKRASRRGRKPKAKKQDVLDALEEAGEDYAAAAEILGVSERTLYRYINRYDLDS
jgi:transcriptional regulator with GAF, ATPase, and Fis domain